MHPFRSLAKDPPDPVEPMTEEREEYAEKDNAQTIENDNRTVHFQNDPSPAMSQIDEKPLEKEQSLLPLIEDRSIEEEKTQFKLPPIKPTAQLSESPEFADGLLPIKKDRGQFVMHSREMGNAKKTGHLREP